MGERERERQGTRLLEKSAYVYVRYHKSRDWGQLNEPSKVMDDDQIEKLFLFSFRFLLFPFCRLVELPSRPLVSVGDRFP